MRDKEPYILILSLGYSWYYRYSGLSHESLVSRSVWAAYKLNWLNRLLGRQLRRSAARRIWLWCQLRRWLRKIAWCLKFSTVCPHFFSRYLTCFLVKLPTGVTREWTGGCHWTTTATKANFTGATETTRFASTTHQCRFSTLANQTTPVAQRTASGLRAFYR